MTIRSMNSTYWSERYQNSDTSWNAKQITTPIKDYIDQLDDKDLRILIPGVGHGHELAYLHGLGFEDVTAVDIAPEPLAYIKKQLVDFPENKLIQSDFFELTGQFDLILEQTFFCALDPSLREKYVRKVAELLSERGKLVGLLFDFPLEQNAPPFGGSQAEYEQLFAKYLNIKKIERAYNSIKPRAGRELFIQIEKTIKND